MSLKVSRQIVDALVSGEKLEAGSLAPTTNGYLLGGTCASPQDFRSNRAQEAEQRDSPVQEKQERENSTLEGTLELSPSLVQHSEAALNAPLRGVPAALQEGINETSFEVYRERYEQVSQGLRVWVLTRGITAPELYARLQATPDPSTFSWTSAPVVEEQVNIPKLSSLLKIMLTPSLTVLSFKQLSLLSSVSQNVFDEFKRFLSVALLHLPSLKSLTLCSHNSRNSLPQCENEHLKLLGLHCPELQYLDISFNKGVTGEGVRALVPSDSTPGCPNLVKLLIFDCAVYLTI